MTDYKSVDGERFRGAEVYGFLKSQRWTLLSSDEGLRVVEDAEGETLVLRAVPGSERAARGPYIYLPGDEEPGDR